MSIDRWLGTWDLLPTNGNKDELAQLWHYLAAQNVGTPYQQLNSGLSQRRLEITMLWELYQRVKPKVVLEVGVAQGGTFASWCYLGEPDATIIGIDRDVNDCRPRHNDPVHPMLSISKEHKTTDQGGGMMHLARHQQKVIPIKGWTTSPSVKEELNIILQGRKIDFCFHDASHEASMFKADFAWLWPLLSDGGVFASHDIMRSDDPKCNKKEAWDEIKSTTDYSALMEFTAGRSEQNMGIGVLIKP